MIYLHKKTALKRKVFENFEECGYNVQIKKKKYGET